MTKENYGKQQIVVTISPEDVAAYEAAVFEDLRKELSISGFRKGFVPEAIARSHIRQEHVFAEAVERAVAEHGKRALEKQNREFVGKPHVEVLKAAPGNPLEFRIMIATLPDVPLTEWRSLRIPFQPKRIEDADIDRMLEDLRRSRAKTRAVLRPAQRGDFVEVDFVTRINGVVVEGGSSQRHPIVLGEGNFVPGFEDAILGMSAGEEKTVRLPFPNDWGKREFAGKEGEFHVTVRNVQERLLPDLDDAFAQTLGKFENLSKLRDSIREGLLQEAREREQRRVRTEAIDRLGEGIPETAIPQELIAQEGERIREELRENVERHGMAFSEYLARLGKNEGEFQEDFHEGAVRRVRAALVLRALAQEAGITVTEEEIASRMQVIREQAGNSGQPLDMNALRSYTENVLKNEKTLELVERTVSGREAEEPDRPFRS